MANKYNTLDQLTQVMNALAGKIKAQGYEQKANLKALAYKDEIAMTDLSTELQTEINNKADSATITQQINTQIGSVYKPGGSRGASFFAVEPTEAMLGYVYNASEEFTTGTFFLEGSGKKYSEGEDVAVVVGEFAYTEVTPEGTENPSELGWFVDNAGTKELSTDTTIVSGTTYFTREQKYLYNVLSGFIDQASFADATEFAEVEAKVNDFETASQADIDALIAGIEITEGQVSPAPNGDTMSY